MSQYHIARNGQQLGVYAEQDIQSGLASGSILSTDLLWTEGMADWQPVGGRFAGSAQPSALQSEFNPYAAPQANVVSSAMAPARELASLGQRLGAAMLDSLVAMVVVGVPYFFAMFSMGMAEGKHQEGLTSGAQIGFAVAGIGFLALIIYNLVLLSTKGQTLGKKWLGIRIVTHPDCQNAGFVKAVILRGFVNGVIGAIPLIGLLYSITDIFFIFREDRRCIHDLIASTQVIKC